MIVVTGANGFIGSGLVWELNQRGRTDIICVDFITPDERPDLLRKRTYVEFIPAGHFLEQVRRGELDHRNPIDFIFHLGACSSTTERNWKYLEEVNLRYSQSLFTACAKSEVPLIYASSAAVYGNGENGFAESTPPGNLKALNLYGESKRQFDEWVLEQTNTPPRWYGLRYFNVFGPNEYHKGAMASVAFKAYQQIKERGSLNLFRSYHPDYRDGEQKRDFIYLKDITRWMYELMVMPSPPPGQIFNMGFGSARTWRDLASAGFQALGRETKIDWIDMPPELREQYQYFTEAEMKRWLSAGMSPPQWPLEPAVTDYYCNYLERVDPYL